MECRWGTEPFSWMEAEQATSNNQRKERSKQSEDGATRQGSGNCGRTGIANAAAAASSSSSAAAARRMLRERPFRRSFVVRCFVAKEIDRSMQRLFPRVKQRIEVASPACFSEVLADRSYDREWENFRMEATCRTLVPCGLSRSPRSLGRVLASCGRFETESLFCLEHAFSGAFSLFGSIL